MLSKDDCVNPDAIASEDKETEQIILFQTWRVKYEEKSFKNDGNRSCWMHVDGNSDGMWGEYINTSSSSGASDSGTAKDEKSSDDIVTLKWIQIGNGQPDNYDAWQAHINEYLADKIGVNIDVEIISWGDWEKRRSTIINTGEDYDIIFSNDVVKESDVRLALIMTLLICSMQTVLDIKSLIPEDYWDAVSVDGKIYGILTYKDSSTIFCMG